MPSIAWIRLNAPAPLEHKMALQRRLACILLEDSITSTYDLPGAAVVVECLAKFARRRWCMKSKSRRAGARNGVDPASYEKKRNRHNKKPAEMVKIRAALSWHSAFGDRAWRPCWRRGLSKRKLLAYVAGGRRRCASNVLHSRCGANGGGDGSSESDYVWLSNRPLTDG